MTATRWGLVLTALVAVAIGVWLWLQPPPPPPPAPVPVAATPVTEPAPPAPDFPVPPPAPDAPPMPALDDSDGAFREALLAVPGAATLDGWLIPDLLVRRIVVTIDNLPRDRVALKLRPLKPVEGPFDVDPAASGWTIGVLNAPRYGAAVTVLQVIDTDALVALYFRWYPRFQQAYRELGYPEGRFNNRVVEVLDHLIATPDVPEPIALVKPKVYYEYADPALENASAGRRLLWRIGRDHRLAVIDKLKAIRARIVAPAG